jgi:hypothetical protein
MEDKKHLFGVGAIVLNLQSLELHLRYFLARMHRQDPIFPKIEDTTAAVNYLTDYKSLTALVGQYNTALSADEKSKFAVDPGVVRIRDAIAHGRLVTLAKTPPFTLWKFGLEFEGKTKVEFCEVLTEEWLVATSNVIERQRERVLQCFKARGYKGLN